MFDNCIKCPSTWIGFIGSSRIEEWKYVEYPKYVWKCYECNSKWDFQGNLMPEGFVEGA